MFKEEHHILRKSIREFVGKEITPYIDEWEEKQEIPRELFRRMGELGFLGLHYPEEYSGQGGDYLSTIVLAEELARCGAGGVGMAVAVQTGMATPPIFKYGTEDQKKNYLVPSIRGEKIACLGITEPNAGSDVASIQTIAKKDGSTWVINGRKIFISNGVNSDYILLLARTKKEKGYRGFSMFIVDKQTPGFIVSRKLNKVGMRCSDTAELLFEDCAVPEENLVGEEGKGFYQIMWELQGERIIGAANAVGRAQAAFEEALRYAQQRVQFGKSLSEFQVIRHYLAEMATNLEAARSLIYNVAWSFQEGEYPVKEISMAKLFAAKAAFRVVDLALQIYGGYGYMMEFPIQRYWRDIRLSRIGGGTDEIMREIIAKNLGI
ncbi:MAG: acyl-CoA dehydrogenase family protein [Desulfotomaculales bacterium]